MRKNNQGHLGKLRKHNSVDGKTRNEKEKTPNPQRCYFTPFPKSKRGKRKLKAKLQRQQAYKYKGKPHFKHVIIIPDEAITTLGWKGGQGLELTVKDGKLIVELGNGA